MRVYVASKARHWPWWQALRAAGLPVTSTWIEWRHNVDRDEPSPDAWREHWKKCVREASECDICLFVSNEGETACGALIELGAALASGAQCFIVSHDWWSVQHHPRCRTFPTLAAAVAAIMAQAAGEQARMEAA